MPMRRRQPTRRVHREHEHPPAEVRRGQRAERRRRRGLADAAGAADDDHLLRREQFLEPRLGCRGSSAGHQFSSSLSAVAISSTARRPPDRANSSGTYSTGMSLRQPVPQPAQVLGARPAQPHREPGGIEHGGDAGADALDEHRPTEVVDALEHLLLAVPERLREDTVGDHGGDVDLGLALHPGDELDGLGDRHLLGGGDDDQPGRRRVLHELEHPSRLLTDEPDVDEIVDRARRADLADDVPARLGIDDDEVVVALTDLVAELADREDLLDAGSGVGDEVEHARQRPDARDERDPDEQPQVLAQRVLGVHRHAEQAGLDFAGLERERADLEGGREGSFGIHLADQDALARRGPRGGPATPRSSSCRPRPCR